MFQRLILNSFQSNAREALTEKAAPLLDEDLSMQAAEKEHILKVLNFTKWNKTKTVSLLKITRPTLDKKIKEYHLVHSS